MKEGDRGLGGRMQGASVPWAWHWGPFAHCRHCPPWSGPEHDPELWESVHPPCGGLWTLNFGQDLEGCRQWHCVNVKSECWTGVAGTGPWRAAAAGGVGGQQCWDSESKSSSFHSEVDILRV